MTARSVVRFVAMGMLALSAWMFLWPSFLGGRATYLVVSGESMERAYSTGDLLVVRERSAYNVGDVAAFETGEGAVVHRIVGGDGESGFVMKGDNRAEVDPWTPTNADIIGSPWLHVPGVGTVLLTVRQIILTPPFPHFAAAILFLSIVAWPTGTKVKRESDGSDVDVEECIPVNVRK